MLRLIFLLLPFFAFAMDPIRVMYVNYNLKEKDFKTAVESVKKSMEGQGLQVMRTLTISDAIRARGNKDFRNYYVIFGCKFEGMDSLLLKAPALTNIAPCSVAVYEDKGKVRATVINHGVFLSKYKDRLTPSERKAVDEVYRKLHSALAKASTNKPRLPKAPPIKDDLVYEEIIEGLDFDTFKTLYKTSLMFFFSGSTPMGGGPP